MYILGISAYYHDSAAALIDDAHIIAAAQEERFTRIKHDFGFPSQAVRYCLKEAGISIEQISYVAFYDKPFIKFNRLLETYLHHAPKGLSSFMKAIPLWIKQKLWIPDLIKKELHYDGPVLFPEHHESHAASAFYPSPFERAAFLTMDGVGEWATSSYGIADGSSLRIMKELHFPHSLGLLYSAFTYFTGFKVNSGEYKVMGLAPYGEPRYVQTILDHLVDLKEDGSFKMNMDYFDFSAGLKMTNTRFSKLFDVEPRKAESALRQQDMDLARSIQDVTERIMMRMARHVKKETREENLVLAGGVALNCVGNGKILRSGIFRDIWIQPAAGDAGGALGSALIVYYQYVKKDKGKILPKVDQQGSYLGPHYSDEEIEKFLLTNEIPFQKYDDGDIIDKTSDYLVDEKVIGWFQGRMEFGPRALGNRSILGDARSAHMQKRMNQKIKFRESFRPFAPSVLEEEVSNWFELNGKSPYMLLVAAVINEKRTGTDGQTMKVPGLEKLQVVRSTIQAVTHVDYSARIQTVNKYDNPRYYRLIQRFFEKTACPVIINTSFNVRGEPIVESPEQAYQCFMRTHMDVLVMGNFMLLKEDQPEQNIDDKPLEHYALD